MEIRGLQLSDLEALIEIRLRALEQTPAAFLTTVEEEQVRGRALLGDALARGQEEGAVFGAVSGDGTLVGMIGIRRGDRPKLRHKAYIWGMHVDAEHRGQGIGGDLLDAAVGHAREHMGVVGVYLSLELGNVGARRLYESRGFVKWGTEPMAMGLEGDLRDEDHMVLLVK